MIVGLGIDIVDIDRIQSKLENNEILKEHIFPNQKLIIAKNKGIKWNITLLGLLQKKPY